MSPSVSPSVSASPSTSSGSTAGGTLGTLATTSPTTSSATGSSTGRTTTGCSPSGGQTSSQPGGTSAAATRTRTVGSTAVGSGGSGGGGGATSLVSAQQQVSQAQAAVAATSLTAPQAGVVESVNLVVGTLPGSPAVVLHATGYQVVVDVAEQDAPFVRVGQTGQATFPALGVSGEFTVVRGPISGAQASSTAGASVVTFPVLLGLPNPRPGLLPGMSAQVSWTAASRTGVLAVPTSAIRSGDTGDVVLAMVGGRPQSEPVTVGLSTTSLTQVVSGLQAGERVVTGVSG